MFQKKLCRWKCEKFTSDGLRIKENTITVGGTRRGDQNCPSFVNRTCSNRLCDKTACSSYHSFGLCEICAESMPLICENIEYGRFESYKRGKCQGTRVSTKLSKFLYLPHSLMFCRVRRAGHFGVSHDPRKLVPEP